MPIFKRTDLDATISRLQEDGLYSVIMEEMANDKIHPGLMARALKKAKGDKQLAEAEYISLRFQNLKDEALVEHHLMLDAEEKKHAAHMEAEEKKLAVKRKLEEEKRAAERKAEQEKLAVKRRIEEEKRAAERKAEQERQRQQEELNKKRFPLTGSVLGLACFYVSIFLFALTSWFTYEAWPPAFQEPKNIFFWVAFFGPFSGYLFRSFMIKIGKDKPTSLFLRNFTLLSVFVLVLYVVHALNTLTT